MIDAAYARTMARYNAWQNRSLYREAARLTDPQRRENRGAFFGSLHATLAHIWWADMMWMSRLDGWEKPQGGSADGEKWIDWEGLCAQRIKADEAIAQWAEGLADSAITGDLTWYSGILQRDVSQPKWLLITHFFNHQTHHRGQAHGILTSFGMKPDATDLPFMPEDA